MPCFCAQAKAGAAQVQALKQHRMRMAAEAATPDAPSDDGDNILIHWVRSASDMRLKVASMHPAAECIHELHAWKGAVCGGLAGMPSFLLHFFIHLCIPDRIACPFAPSQDSLALVLRTGMRSSKCPDVEVFLQEDIHAKLQTGQDYGAERLAFVADTWMGRLDPAEHLNPGRHGEWTMTGGQVCCSTATPARPPKLDYFY